MKVPLFPNFYQLQLQDAEEYESLIRAYPAISDLAFPTLTIWWVDDQGGLPKVALLNGNLVIDYPSTQYPELAGLCLIGTSAIEESVTALRHYLESQNRDRRLVHVPEITVQAGLARLSEVALKPEREYDEYLLDAGALSRLDTSEHGRTRRRIHRFERECDGKSIRVEELLLADPFVREMLRNSFAEWEDRYGSRNDRSHDERAAFDRTLHVAERLNLQGLALYVDNVLYGFAVYQLACDNCSFIVNHVKVQYDIRYTFDYVTHMVARRAVETGVPVLNFEMDLGIDGLREHKMGLKPLDFHRKYTVML